MDDPRTPRQQYEARWAALKNERSSWWPVWQDISKFILPRAGRFFTQDRNRGDARHNNIYDSTGGEALNILAAGMMSGMTSPARPWVKLSTGDPDLDKFPAVKEWLAQCTRILLDTFASSNIYRALHTGYEELGAFGTDCSILLPDPKNVIHAYPLTTGEYALGQDFQGNINTLYREFDKTVGELVLEFGRDNCSQTVRNLFDRGNFDTWVTVTHAIEPRALRDTSKRDKFNMPYQSCYFETGSNSTQLLSEGGFEYFPGLASRWALSGGDIYGTGPGVRAIGDVKSLQHEQTRKAQGIDFQTMPPLQAPASLKHAESDRLPGGITYVDAVGSQNAIRSLFEVNLNLQHLLEDIRDVRERIRTVFSADLFLMMANTNKNNMTATEVAERHEEKMLMLGPVVERVQTEKLEPLVENTFIALANQGKLPPPPQEMQGRELKVVFISILAQAQRAVATNSVDKFVANLGSIAAVKPDLLDRLDHDKWADVYSDMLGVDPTIVVPLEKAAIIRENRAKAIQQQQQAAQLEQLAGAAQKAGSVQTQSGSSNVVADLMRQYQGYN